MYQAQVNAWGESPKYVEVSGLPTPDSNEVRVTVEAVGCHRVVRSRAAGNHYSSGTPPHVPGIDGVGYTIDGQKVYFTSWATGTMSELVNVPKHSVFPLPQDIDPVQVAALVNPAISSWMALKARTSHLPENFKCLIIGATSASGRVAISLARSLGAKTVIGAARNKSTLDALGLDGTVVIAEDPEKTDFSDLTDVDVVLDYVFGPLTTHFFNTIQTAKPLQYVHIGGLSATEIELPGAVLRAKDITIRGSGPGAWGLDAANQMLPELLKIVSNISSQPVKVAALRDVEGAWDYQGPERLVFVP